MRLSLAEFKVMVRDQFFVLQLEPERAIEVLASLVPETEARKELLKQVRAIASAGDPLDAAEDDRLRRLSQILTVPIAKPTGPAPQRPWSPLGHQSDRQAGCRAATETELRLPPRMNGQQRQVLIEEQCRWQR